MGIDVIEEIRGVGGFYDDPSLHFVYKSGKHGHAYLNMDPLFPYVSKMHQIAAELGGPFAGTFDAVVGSATGGIPIATMVALLFNAEICVWADKAADGFDLERDGFPESLYGRRVLYVEDILNTGDTSSKTLRLIEQAGGTVVGGSCACNRGRATAKSLQIPKLVQLSRVRMKAYRPSACPGCKQKLKIITDLGHGDAFKKLYPAYPGGFRRLRAA